MTNNAGLRQNRLPKVKPTLVIRRDRSGDRWNNILGVITRIVSVPDASWYHGHTVWTSGRIEHGRIPGYIGGHERVPADRDIGPRMVLILTVIVVAHNISV